LRGRRSNRRDAENAEGRRDFFSVALCVFRVSAVTSSLKVIFSFYLVKGSQNDLMKTVPKLLLFFLLFAASCSDNNRKNSLLKISTLLSEIYNIDIQKDTVLITRKGAIIKIPKNSLTSLNGSSVKLEIKEAFSFKDIVLAGLTTTSDGQLLSSGGMIYISAVGENTVKITGPIAVSIPTGNINPDMRLYKGEIRKDSVINWTNPINLTRNDQTNNRLDNGKELFFNNCISCHSIGKEGPGPDLRHILKKFPRHGEGSSRRLYEHIRYPIETVQKDRYFRCLKEKYYGLKRQAFPSLINEELDNVFDYIENESYKRNLSNPDMSLLKCIDSCENYENTREWLLNQKQRLSSEPTEMVQEKTTAPQTPDSSNPTGLQRVRPDDLVDPVLNTSLYYQFTIESFGWYNIDILVKDKSNSVESELFVRMIGQYKETFNIYLAIPSLKVFGSGGKLNTGEGLYGFEKKDGTIVLPQDIKAYVIAIGEYEDQILFSKKEFTISKKQELQLELKTVAKELFYNEIKSLSIDGLSIDASDTKNATELRKTIKDLKDLEKLKPTACDCNCGNSDTTGAPRPQAANQVKIQK
jgi:hypothetical protein